MKIRFGTDGWRGIIADDFTFENVRAVTQAFCDYASLSGDVRQGIAISYDTRFLSQEFAQIIAEIAASNRMPVLLSSQVTPTPALSFAVKHHNLFAGIMVTASHNPYYYNGIKFKEHHGGPASEKTTEGIEKLLHKNKYSIDRRLIGKYLQKVDFLPAYIAHLKKYVDFPLLKSSRLRMLYDPMHGAGSRVMETLLRESSLGVLAINDKVDLAFGERLPEPVLANLQDLQRGMRTGKYDLGLATDGDADRFSVLAPDGEFIQLHDLLPLLCEYLIKSRKWSGNIVRTTSMANMIDKVAEEHQRTVTEVPVGFRNVAAKMLCDDILIGGEDSGGFGYKMHIPDRDGILSCLLTLEMLAARKTGISKLVRELRERYGPFHYENLSCHSDPAVLRKNMASLRRRPPSKIGNFKVDRVNLLDGIKFYLEDDSWTLLRVSDTELVGRIYAGSANMETAAELAKAGEKLLTSGA